MPDEMTITPMGDGTNEIRGTFALEPLTRSRTHEIDVATTTFRCPSCDEDHPLAFVVDRDVLTEKEADISIRWPEEAWALAEFLLVYAFAEVSEGTWLALKTMAEIDAKKPPGEVMN
jgi:hypothetical protein